MQKLQLSVILSKMEIKPRIGFGRQNLWIATKNVSNLLFLQHVIDEKWKLKQQNTSISGTTNTSPIPAASLESGNITSMNK